MPFSLQNQRYKQSRNQIVNFLFYLLKHRTYAVFSFFIIAITCTSYCMIRSYDGKYIAHHIISHILCTSVWNISFNDANPDVSAKNKKKKNCDINKKIVGKEKSGIIFWINLGQISYEFSFVRVSKMPFVHIEMKHYIGNLFICLMYLILYQVSEINK